MRKLLQLPDWVMSGSQAFRVVSGFNQEVFKCTEEAVQEAVDKPKKGSINVMSEIIQNSSLSPEEKDLNRLKQEVSDRVPPILPL